MNWELFVDEFGTFGAKEPCLFGGWLFPAGRYSDSMLTAWKNTIKNLPEIRDAMRIYQANGGEEWNYDHCSENNGKTPGRAAVQLGILEQYSHFAKKEGGKMVAFACKNGIDNIDNTTNYLTVFSKGLMMLFSYLRETDNNISLQVYAAVRPDYTRFPITGISNPGVWTVSPTRAALTRGIQSFEIIPEQYRLQIQNLAFLQGGHALLNDQAFADMINLIKIIPDKIDRTPEGREVRRPHPLTVPCDYVCNTYKNYILGTYNSESKEIQDRAACLFGKDHILRLNTEGAMPRSRVFTQKDKVSSEALINLFSTDFPAQDTVSFIQMFNQESHIIQTSVLEGAIDALKEPVQAEVAMEIWAGRLQKGIEVAKGIENESLRAWFTANLLLYQRALFNHLGRQTDAKVVHKLASEQIMGISDADIADKLTILAENQNIVGHTDNFDYDEATYAFLTVKEYWEGRIKNSPNKNLRYPEYGKEIGSYLQLLTHQMHSGDENKRKDYYNDALEVMPVAQKHLSEAVDMARYHQNCCDIEAEMGHYEKAMWHLWRACQYLQGVVTQKVEATQEEMIGVVSEYIKSNLARIDAAFTLLHLIRLIDLMYATDVVDEQIDSIISQIVQYAGKNATSITIPHARTQIMWRTGSSILLRKNSTEGQRKEAFALFQQAAADCLQQKEAVYAAIAAGVYAELISHIKAGRVANSSVANEYSNLQTAYQVFLDRQGDSLDPFKPFVSQGGLLCTEDSAAKYWQISVLIGY